MSTVQDGDGNEFIKGLEAKRGCPVGWRTYSTFYADSNGVVRQYGVFLYEAGGHFWFEDFEHEPQILGFKLPKSKNAAPYVKFESGFDPNDVLETRTVKKNAAKSLAGGFKPRSKVKAAGILARCFSQCVTEVSLKDGTVLFFELADKTLQNMIDNWHQYGKNNKA